MLTLIDSAPQGAPTGWGGTLGAGVSVALCLVLQLQLNLQLPSSKNIKE